MIRLSVGERINH